MEQWNWRAESINDMINFDYGINLVTCGECGKIFSHTIYHEGELECPHCKMKSDPCDFPDLFT